MLRPTHEFQGQIVSSGLAMGAFNSTLEQFRLWLSRCRIILGTARLAEWQVGLSMGLYRGAAAPVWRPKRCVPNAS
jgi:hypothetical protein